MTYACFEIYSLILIYSYIYTQIYTYTYTWIYICIYWYIYARISVTIYLNVHKYIHVHIHMFITWCNWDLGKEIFEKFVPSTIATSVNRIKHNLSLWPDRLLDWKDGDPGREQELLNLLNMTDFNIFTWFFGCLFIPIIFDFPWWPLVGISTINTKILCSLSSICFTNFKFPSILVSYSSSISMYFFSKILLV